jgi:hypothetical protein
MADYFRCFLGVFWRFHENLSFFFENKKNHENSPNFDQKTLNPPFTRTAI